MQIAVTGFGVPTIAGPDARSNSGLPCAVKGLKSLGNKSDPHNSTIIGARCEHVPESLLLIKLPVLAWQKIGPRRHNNLDSVFRDSAQNIC